MCGIYGLYAARGGIDQHRVAACRDRLRHRGPDDAGLWVSADGRVALGHRRLSIIDLSAAGHQPMHDADSRCTVVFNGEIYNYKELKQELEAKGISFVSDSDTEVLLAAYRHWGDDCVSHFNGMFAFVIHDRGDVQTPPSLYFARDRAGKKPFYYTHGDGSFEFGSELKALSSTGQLSMTALNYYLSLGYVPDALCIAEGVNKLPPAHRGRLDLSTGRLSVSRYWSLPSASETQFDDGDYIADEVEKLLLDSTRIRLRSDVPVGILLSGGLDSSLITAAAAKTSSGTIKTFSMSLPGSALDESERARQISRHFSTEHFELPLDSEGLGALSEIEPFIDEPLADSSLIPTYLLSKLTRRHVTVALGGDGGDEVFGGYRDYSQSLSDARRFGWLPDPIFAAAAKGAAMLPAGVRGRNRIVSLRQGPLQQMIWGRPYFDIALRGRILSSAAQDRLNGEEDAPEQFLLKSFNVGGSSVDRMTRTHFGSILPDDFLFKIDRASMMVALEMRSPFLDYRLVEFSFKHIPDAWKVTQEGTRLIQRKIAKRWLPNDFDHAPKMGFSIPLDHWLREASDRWHQAWLDRLPPAIDRKEALGLLSGLKDGRSNGARIFALMMLGICTQNLKLS